MNILIAVKMMSAANGGVTTHIIDLCKQFCEYGHNVVLVSDDNYCDYQNKIDELKQLKNFSYNHCDLNNVSTNIFEFYNSVNDITKIVREKNIEIIHVHSESLCPVCSIVKLRTRINYIWTNHIDEMANPKLFKVILKLLRFPIISVSSDLKEFLIKEFGVDEKRINVIKNGIDLSRFKPLSQTEKEELIDKYKCSDFFVISLLARLSWGKGHKYLLKAIKILQEKYKISNIKILIAGKLHSNEENYLQELISYSKSNNINMEYIGFQNPRDIFGISDLSVVPSIFEGFALTVLESIAMDCPVIRSNTPGWSDTKEFSLVFEKANIDQLVEKIFYAYTNKAEMEKMVINGKNKIYNEYNIDIQAKRTIEVYEKYRKQ